MGGTATPGEPARPVQQACPGVGWCLALLEDSMNPRPARQDGALYELRLNESGKASGEALFQTLEYFSTLDPAGFGRTRHAVWGL